MTSKSLDGLASVQIGGNRGFIDRSGNLVIPPEFSFTGCFRNGLCLVTTEDEIGYINRRGDFVWRGPFVESRLGFDLRH